MEKIETLKVNLDQAAQSVDKLNKEVDELGNSFNQVAQSASNFEQIQFDMVDVTENVARGAAGMAGAFEVVQGTLGLLGVESEDAEKAIQKMMQVMQVTQGFQAIAEGARSYKVLKQIIKEATAATVVNSTATKANAVAQKGAAVASNGLVKALKAVKAAMLSNPWTAIAVAITTAVTALVAFTNKNNDAVKTQERLKDSFDKTTDKIENQNRELARRLKLMEAEGKSRKEILEVELKQLKIEEEAYKKEIDHIRETTEYIEYDWLGREKGYTKEYKEAVARINELLDDVGERIKDKQTEINAEVTSTQRAANKQAEKDLEDSLDKREQLLKDYKDFKKNLLKDVEKLEKNELQISLDSEEELYEQKIEQLKKYKDERIITEEQYNNDLLLARQLLYKNQYNTLHKYLDSESITYKQLLQEANKLHEENINKITKDSDKLIDAKAEAFEKITNDPLSGDADVEAAYKIWAQNWEFYNGEKIKRINEENDRYKETLDKLANKQLRDDLEKLKRNAVALEKNYNSLINAESIKGNVDKVLQYEEEYNEKLKNNLNDQANILYKLGIKGEIYNDIVIAIADVESRLNAINIEKLHVKIDKIQNSLSILSESFNTLNSMGGAIGLEWGVIFDTMSSGLEKIRVGFTTNIEAAHKAGDAYHKYGQIASTTFALAANVLTTIAAEQTSKMGELQENAKAEMDKGHQKEAEMADKNAEKSFLASKRLKIASAYMSMFSGILDAWSSAMQFPWPFNLAVGGAMTGMIATMGGINIAKIKKTQYKSAIKEESATAASTPSISALQSLSQGVDYTTNIEGASTEGKIKDTRVYVLESDISQKQNNVKVTEAEATF